MTKRYLFPALLLLASFLSARLSAQSDEKSLIRYIFEQDSLFWNAYNHCDDQACRSFFTENVEFYHDKGGITYGADNLAASIKNNLCSNPQFKLRREAVSKTVQVYPLAKDGQFYGAIISGEHAFFVTEYGQPEYQSGVARFNQLWLKQDDTWRMARILSYDHQPPR